MVGLWVSATLRAMFIRHDVHVDQSAYRCRRELLEPAERWLPASVTRVAGERRFLARVGFDAAAARISKQVELTIGPPTMEGDWLVIPLAWRATGPSQLFPVLDGKLAVQPGGPHSSRLSISGTYQPPLGALGREVDGAMLHNVAEATIKDFVEGVAARISELAGERSD